MEQPPNVQMPFNGSAEVGKDPQRFEVVEKGVGELLGRAGVVLALPIKNLFQIG